MVKYHVYLWTCSHSNRFLVDNRLPHLSKQPQAQPPYNHKLKIPPKTHETKWNNHITLHDRKVSLSRKGVFLPIWEHSLLSWRHLMNFVIIVTCPVGMWWMVWSCSVTFNKCATSLSLGNCRRSKAWLEQ